MEDALIRVAQFTEQQEDIKGRTLGAMAYRWLAAAYGQLGRELEAKAAAEEYLKRTPDFSLASHLEILPFQHAEDREHYAAGLRKAGLSE